MNKMQAIRRAGEILNNNSPVFTKEDVMYLLSKVLVSSTYDQKHYGAKLLVQNVRLFTSGEFCTVVDEYITRTGYKPHSL